MDTGSQALSVPWESELKLHAQRSSRGLGVLYMIFGFTSGLAGLSASSADRLSVLLTMFPFGLIVLSIGARLSFDSVRVSSQGIIYRRFLGTLIVPIREIVDVEVGINRGIFSTQETLIVITSQQRIPLTLLAAYTTKRGQARLAATRDATKATLHL